MKKQLLLVIIVLSVLISANAKASSKPYCPPAKPTPPATHLPINSGIAFLMVAGAAIGITTVSKAKSLKAVAVKA
jgi:hypothetical protein